MMYASGLCASNVFDMSALPSSEARAVIQLGLTLYLAHALRITLVRRICDFRGNCHTGITHGLWSDMMRAICRPSFTSFSEM